MFGSNDRRYRESMDQASLVDSVANLVQLDESVFERFLPGSWQRNALPADGRA